MPDALQPVAVHRLRTLSGGVDLCSDSWDVAIGRDWFLIAEPNTPADEAERHDYGANDEAGLPCNRVVAPRILSADL